MSQKPPLTSSELATLWNSYLQNSMSIGVMDFFLHKAEDPEIVPIIESMRDLTLSNTETIRTIWEKEGIAGPTGFTDNDVNLGADRLFDDTFILTYLYRMSKVGMLAYSLFQSMAAREDLCLFFADSLKRLSELQNECNLLILERGTFVRSPYIPLPKTAEMIQDQSYFGGFSPFRENRPLNVIEISHIHENLQTNLLGMMLCTGFAQTARLQPVRDYLYRGAEIAKKHVQVFSKLLMDSNIQAPMTWNNQVSASVDPPFSDKLMMYHIAMLVSSGIGNYATAVSASLRKDIRLTYGRLAAEIAQYAEDGAELMVEHQWLEEPPQMVDRQAIKNR